MLQLTHHWKIFPVETIYFSYDQTLSLQAFHWLEVEFVLAIAMLAGHEPRHSAIDIACFDEALEAANVAGTIDAFFVHQHHTHGHLGPVKLQLLALLL